MINVLTIRKHQTIQSTESLVFKFRGTRTASPLLSLVLLEQKLIIIIGAEWRLLWNYLEINVLAKRECCVASVSGIRGVVVIRKRATWHGRLKPVTDKPRNHGKRPNSEAPIPTTLPACLRMVTIIDTFHVL